MANKSRRIVITNDDEGGWFVRRVRMSEHDCDKDEKVYRCDQPIGRRYDTIGEAIDMAKQYLGMTP